MRIILKLVKLQNMSHEVLPFICVFLVSYCLTKDTLLGDLRWVARFGLMSQIGASQIEAPIGSVFQKYVSNTFMVKMRIDLGS